MARKQVSCPVERTLGILAGRWKVMIIHQLLEGTKRFNQLQRELSGITHRTLAKQLREMEESGLVRRHDYREIPPRVDYALTPLGLSLRDVLQSMHVWAERHCGDIPAPRNVRSSLSTQGPSPAAARAARSIFGDRRIG
jgi:DNA-binding HxlR family transcriptional regulator